MSAKVVSGAPRGDKGSGERSITILEYIDVTVGLCAYRS